MKQPTSFIKMLPEERRAQAEKVLETVDAGLCKGAGAAKPRAIKES